MAQRTTRKRTRDGSSVLTPLQQQSQPPPLMFDNRSLGYKSERPAYGANYYPEASNFPPMSQKNYDHINSQPQLQGSSGNEMTRVAQGNPAGPLQQYTGINNVEYAMPNNVAATSNQATISEDEGLERRANIAKRDADGRKRQIPPFVQKLSRYGINILLRQVDS